MALIRLQNKVPDVYVNESRDFQLILRLYDVLVNSLKYDIDGITRVVDTGSCKSTILQLLQTKLGFFSEKEFTDTTLRYILQGFPSLIKRKGTVSAIKEAIYIFLKANGLETEIKIDIIEDTPTTEQIRLYGARVTDHSVVIGIESNVRDITPLREMLKYIIPFGYNLFFYFFVGQESREWVAVSNKAELMIISNDVNGMAGSKPIKVKDPEGKLIIKDWDDEKHWYKKPFEAKHVAAINNIEAVYNYDYDYPEGKEWPHKPKQETNIMEDIIEIKDHED